jgi:hypothetical protein
MLKFAVKRKLIPLNPLSDIYAKEDLQIKKRSVRIPVIVNTYSGRT